MNQTAKAVIVSLVNSLPLSQREDAMKFAQWHSDAFFASNMGYQDDFDVVDQQAWIHAAGVLQDKYFQ